jgi:hypothetical protein
MIGKLLRGMIALIVYGCVATVISQVVLAAYFSRTLHLDRGKLVQMLAIAYDIELPGVRSEAEAEPKPAAADQPSFEQLLEARAAKSRNLELREQALQNGLGQLRFELDKTTAEKKQVSQLRDVFYADLQKMQTGKVAEGFDENRRILESLKAKQAKELITQMLTDNKLDEVVTLLTPMTENKRAKILAEFKTPAEIEKIAELLRRLREGAPVADKAEDTQRKLEPPPQTAAR